MVTRVLTTSAASCKYRVSQYRSSLEKNRYFRILHRLSIRALVRQF